MRCILFFLFLLIAALGEIYILRRYHLKAACKRIRDTVAESDRRKIDHNAVVLELVMKRKSHSVVSADNVDRRKYDKAEYRGRKTYYLLALAYSCRVDDAIVTPMESSARVNN